MGCRFFMPASHKYLHKMKELVKITDNNGKKAVSARELHRVLKSGTRFNDWIDYRKKQYELIDGVDYQILNENLVEVNQFTEISVKLKRGPKGVDYALSLECAKQLAMIENNEEGKKVRLYFIKAEQKYQDMLKPIGDVGKVYPLIYKDQIGIPRRELFLLSGYSPNSGTVSALKKKYPEHFFMIRRTACVSVEFAKLRYSQGKVRQLEIDFRNKSIGGHKDV